MGNEIMITSIPTSHLKESEKDVYICPSCYKRADIYYSNISNVYVESKVGNNLAVYSSDVNFIICCSECGEVMFKCDPMLVDRIISLNKLGLHTLYCCEGHIDNYINHPVTNGSTYLHVRTPYLVFCDLDREDIEFIEGLINNPNYLPFISLNLDDRWTIQGLLYGEEILPLIDPKADPVYADRVKTDFRELQNKFIGFIDEIIKRG